MTGNETKRTRGKGGLLDGWKVDQGMSCIGMEHQQFHSSFFGKHILAERSIVLVSYMGQGVGASHGQQHVPLWEGPERGLDPGTCRDETYPFFLSSFPSHFLLA